MEQVSGSSFSALTILGFLEVDVDTVDTVDTAETVEVLDSFDMVLSISVKIDGIKFYIRIYESLRLFHRSLFDRRRNNPFISGCIM